jgi:hypothetical protein
MGMEKQQTGEVGLDFSRQGIVVVDGLQYTGGEASML